MARKGEEEIDAKSGVQGVSSSAWLEMIKVPVGKMPLCQVASLGHFLVLLFSFSRVRSCRSIPPSASLMGEWVSNKGWGIRRSCLRFFWMEGSNVDHVFRLRASKPHPSYPSRSNTSTSTPLPHPISTKPGNLGFCTGESCRTPSPLEPLSSSSYMSFHNSIRKAAMPRSSKTCLLGSVCSTQLPHSRFACFRLSSVYVS